MASAQLREPPLEIAPLVPETDSGESVWSDRQELPRVTRRPAPPRLAPDFHAELVA